MTIDARSNAPDMTTTLALGALAGVVGVWALDRLDWAMWRRQPAEARARTVAVRPGGEPPAQALVTKVEGALGSSLSPDAHEVASQVVHYAIGVAPAVGYAVVRHRLPGPSLVRGALFGLGLWAVQDEGLNTITGLGASPRAYPWQDHARGVAAHMLFGVVVETVLAYADEGRDAFARPRLA